MSDQTRRDNAAEKLMDAHRILGESRMVRTETDPKSLTDEDVQAIIANIKQYKKDLDITNRRIATGLLISPTTVSEILSGKYAADPRPLLVAMDRWLERRWAAKASITDVPEFCPTSVAKLIRLAAQRAMSAADMGLDSRIALVWGDPGCGKTMALEALEEKEGAILITCDFHASSPTGILEKIARALKLPAIAAGRKLYQSITDRLRGSGKLLIIDEIHALLSAGDDNAFHTLRRLSGETGCPQLWAASCDLITELRHRSVRREPLTQIVSRIGVQIHLTAPIAGQNGDGGRPLFSVEEIIQIYGRNEMRLSTDAAKFLARLTCSPSLGLLRTTTSLVAHATMMNRAVGGELTVDMLWEAAQMLNQASELETIYDQCQDELPRPKIAAV